MKKSDKEKSKQSKIKNQKRQKIFSCEICSKELSSQFYLAKHLRSVHSKKDFICDYDGKHFNTKDKLRLHILQHRIYYRVECSVCKKVYSTDQSMRKHLRTHFEQHQCDICGQTFKYKNLLANHKASIHEKEPKIPCNYCTRLFSNTSTRDAHHKIIHENQKFDTQHFKCTDCPLGFEMKEDLRLHSFIHFDGEIHTCCECHQIFKKKKLLNIHMRKHESADFICQHCDYSFKYKSNLGKHLRSGRCKGLSIENSSLKFLSPEDEAKQAKSQLIDMTVSSLKKEELINETISNEIGAGKISVLESIEKLELTKTRKKLTKKVMKENLSKKLRKIPKKLSAYVCDLCGFEVSYKSHMLSHVRTHAASNRHKCAECLESFPTQLKLHKHSMKAHGHGTIGSVQYSKYSSVMCPVCGMMFSRERIRYHLKNHEEEVHKCDHCSKVFRKKLTLERHIECNHSTEKRFVCATCGKSFSQNRILKQHETIHNPIKLYIHCDICQTLMQVKSLKMHMETQHGDKYKEKFFLCECGKGFRYEKQLQKHKESVHEKVSRGIVYSCDECDCNFSRRSELRLHSFEHYSGKIFHCSECGMKFKKQKLLKVHSAVHKEQNWPCKFCPSTFQTKGGRQKHSAKAHGQHCDEIIEIPPYEEELRDEEN